jgi:aryl-alcohol dehydrogenase-like predicted oxidoreductase
MTTLRLGRSGPEITRIGLGTWAIGGSGWKYGWGSQEDEDSVAVIHEAIDLGINWIDTAAVYGLGHSEEVVGRALKGKRDKVLVATKCSRTWSTDGSIASVLDADSIREELEASLRRLKTDRIDLYQVHWPTPDPKIEEAWTEIARAVKAGKVRWAGVSNFNPQQMRRIQGILPITSLQPPFSMLRREVEKEILPFCAQNGIGVICYSPMQMGLLSGKFNRERVASLAADDLRGTNPYFIEPALSRNLELVEKLRPIAQRRGRSVGELAIAWVLSRPGVTAAIVGGRRPGQAKELAGAADWVLSEDELAAIGKALAEREAQEAASS